MNHRTDYACAASLVALAALCGCDEIDATDDAELELACEGNPDCVDGVHPSLMSADDPQSQPTAEQAFPGQDVVVEHGFVRTAGGVMEVDARRRGDLVAFGGDMVATAEEFDANFFATREEALADPVVPDGASAVAILPIGSRHWPGGVIPYAIDPSLSDVSRVYDAIAVWENNTPFWFAERDECAASSSCITFTDDDGCWSFIGHQTNGQEISLQNGSCTMGNAIHEIGHAIGFRHAHVRTDRDAHVTIHWNNIENGRESNFERYVDAGFAGSDLGAYDFDSVMHYGSTAFGTRVWGFLWKRTTISTTGGQSIGQRDHLSTNDIAAAFLRADPQAVVAFAGANYTGNWQAFDAGSFFANQGDLSQVGNDTVSSLLVPPGYFATLCAHENASPCQSYTANTTHVGSTLNNRASKIQVGGMVTVFEDRDFSGVRETFGWGDHWAADFTTLGNDRASSLVIGPGVQATVCAHEQADPCQTYAPNTRVPSLPTPVHDQVSRVLVTPIFTPIPLPTLPPQLPAAP